MKREDRSTILDVRYDWNLCLCVGVGVQYTLQFVVTMLRVLHCIVSCSWLLELLVCGNDWSVKSIPGTRILQRFHRTAVPTRYIIQAEKDSKASFLPSFQGKRGYIQTETCKFLIPRYRSLDQLTIFFFLPASNYHQYWQIQDDGNINLWFFLTGMFTRVWFV